MPTRAKKQFGQHFLEPAWVRKLAQAIHAQSTETFLEIGPGRGALTRPLVEAANRVVAFEIDRQLAEDLRATAPENLTIVEGNFLEATREGIESALPAPSGALRVAGNLPYNVASPILVRLVDLYAQGLQLTDATVMLQREVAERLLARPGTKEYGTLTIVVRHWASVERRLILPPGAFRPAPRVQSAVVTLHFHPAAPPAKDEALLRKMTQAVFSRRRKTLANALLAFPASERLPPAEVLRQTGIDGKRRPETLEIAEFVALSNAFSD